MDSFTEVEIRSQLVWLIVIDGQCLLCQLLCFLLLVLDHGFVEAALCDTLLEYTIIREHFFLRVFCLIFLAQ